MEIKLLWIASFFSVTVVYFQDTLVKFALPQYFPGLCGFNGTVRGWIDSRNSLSFDANGDIVSMRKCPLEKFLTPPERMEMFLLHIVWCVVISMAHSFIVMIMLGY